MRKSIVAVAVATLAGCSGQARIDYYNSIAEANRAEAAAYQAKAEALKAVAQADPSTAGAVAMALALSSARTVAPTYIEDEGLSYTKALAGPLAGLGGAFIAADVAKQGIKSNERVQIQASQASSTTLVGIADAIATGNAASNQAIVDVANAPREGVVDADFAQAALSSVETVATQGQDSLVDVANAGLDSTVTMGTAGLNTSESIATQGFNTVETMALDNNATILELSNNLQPIITPVEVVTPTVIQPVVSPAP